MPFYKVTQIRNKLYTSTSTLYIRLLVSMVKKISLIIPCQNAETNLFVLLSHIPQWKAIPSEIIIVDSSKKEPSIPEDFKLFIKKLNINLCIIHQESLYPGHARNIGIYNATNTLLAFLDTSTHPTKEWLSSSITIMKSHDSDGVWGKTYYKTDTFVSKIFRACTYGEKPIKTLPGSVIKKDIFNKCGLFVENVRAGEDGDWMSRVELHDINIPISDQPLIYNELNNISFRQLIKKWFRNYIHTAKLPFFKAHKNYYYYGVSFVAVLLAYNWNRVLAAWDRESIFFIPNITTISVILLFLSYIFIRGIILPKKKGVNFRFIFPINFIFIFLLSSLLDLTKTLAFILAKFPNKLK